MGIEFIDQLDIQECRGSKALFFSQNGPAAARESL